MNLKRFMFFVLNKRLLKDYKQKNKSNKIIKENECRICEFSDKRNYKLQIKET